MDESERLTERTSQVTRLARLLYSVAGTELDLYYTPCDDFMDEEADVQAGWLRVAEQVYEKLRVLIPKDPDDEMLIVVEDERA